MIPKINYLLGRSVLVSIPALFSDGACRPYKLLGFELNGLWLQSDELNRRLLADDTPDLAESEPAVFVPFAQIAAVLVPTVVRGTPRPGGPQSPAAAQSESKEEPTASPVQRPASQRRTGQAQAEGAPQARKT